MYAIRSYYGLSPHTTEMLYAIGAGPALVAVDEASDWPAPARQLPRVANFQSLNTEALLALQPDLVVLWRGASARVEATLAPFGIPVLSLRSQQLADLPREIRLLGLETGHQAAAEALASRIELRLTSLKQRYGHQPRVRLFYQLWSPPLMTVAKGTWIQEAIALCGGGTRRCRVERLCRGIGRGRSILERPTAGMAIVV